MLLRRIAKHVKDQNWFAVALDFVIVVAGILIAFQITNWNEARVEAKREQVLLERLHLDFEGIVAWGDRAMPWVDDAPDNVSRLIDQIRSDAEPEFDDAFRRSAQASVFIYAAFEMSPTYQELVSTGTLSRISNPELRDTLASYGRNRDAELIVTEGLYAIQNKGVMREAIRFQSLGDDPDISFDEENSEITLPISFDWEALKMTEPHLHVILQNQLYVRGWKQATYKDARRVLTLLKEELGVPADPAVDNADTGKLH
ncbi:MAG: DUF6090 family protein [Pseudomonadota bacterium]